MTEHVEPAFKHSGSLRVAHLQLHVVEVDDVTVGHRRQVEGHRLHPLAVGLLRVVAVDGGGDLNALPLGGVVDVAKQLVVVVVAGLLVGLGLKHASLLGHHAERHAQLLARGDLLVGVDEELAVPRSEALGAVGLHLVAGLVGLGLSTDDDACAVVSGVGGVFHDFGKALELAVAVVLLSAALGEFHALAPVVAPEAAPHRVLLAFQVAVDNQILPL